VVGVDNSRLNQSEKHARARLAARDDVARATKAEIEARHCLGMCWDWAGHPAYEGGDHAGLREFLERCGASLRWQMDEIERLRALQKRPRAGLFGWSEYWECWLETDQAGNVKRAWNKSGQEITPPRLVCEKGGAQ